MINKSVLLHRSQAEAFILFTARISQWWPKTHRLTKDPESEVFMEPSGRFWERAKDGREVELGRVLRWDPPHTLELDFYIGTSAAQPTALTVTFAPEGDATRILIHHRSKPEGEDLWNVRVPVFDRSWEAVLAALQDT